MSILPDWLRTRFNNLRDALRGTGNKTLTDLDTNTSCLIDDTVKGLLRSIGDAGATPTNVAGNTLLSILDLIHTALNTAYSPQSAYNSSTAAALTVSLDLSGIKGRTQVEVWVKSSAAATFTVQGSTDGITYRDTDTISLSVAGEEHRGYSNAYPYIQVTTADANDNEIEIVGSR